MSSQEICTDCDPKQTPTDSPLAAVTPAPAPAPASAELPKTPLVQIDSSTFSPPKLDNEVPRVIVEFCDRCRWLHRATWTLTELFLTFPPIPATPTTPQSGLASISLLPRSAPETGGRFRVWLYRHNSLEAEYDAAAGQPDSWDGWDLVWDRKVEGGFPEMKVLKQRIRNLIEPSKDLGHSGKQPAAKPALEQTALSPVVTPAEAVAPASTPAESAPAEWVPTIADYEPQYRC